MKIAFYDTHSYDKASFSKVIFSNLSCGGKI